MTREEAIEELKEINFNSIYEKTILATNMAIDALKAMPCDDAISRQAVINAIANTCFWLSADNWEELTKCINSISPVNPQPKTGHWIRMKAYEKWGCSECNTVFRFTFKEHDYCPNCGAKMVEPQEKRCSDCKHYGKLSLDCGRCDDDCSMFEQQQSEVEE